MRTNFRHRAPKKERLLQQVCPTTIEDQAEDYFLGRLPRAEAARFEEHLLVCSHCVMKALRAMAFLEEMGRMPPAPAREGVLTGP